MFKRFKDITCLRSKPASPVDADYFCHPSSTWDSVYQPGEDTFLMTDALNADIEEIKA